MIRLIIADDMKEYRDHFRMLLENENDITVVAVVSNEKDVIEKAFELKPDVILMDIQMDSDASGIYATREILAKLPEIKIIMLSIHSDKDNVINSYEAGAADFVEKTASVNEILSAIRASVSEKQNAGKINQIVVKEFVKLKKERESIVFAICMLSKLSRTELEILKAVADGYKYREIAEKRFVEEVTVRSIASKICSKFGIKPLKEVVRTFEQLKLIDLLDELIKER